MRLRWYKVYDVLLVTFPARYIHPSFALRYLKANLSNTCSSHICEFDSFVSPVEAVERILELKPLIVCFSCYIWNVDTVRKTCTILKKVAPEIRLVVGGPEFDGIDESEPLLKDADYIVQGEGEFVLDYICRHILDFAGTCPGDSSGNELLCQPLRIPESAGTVSGKRIKAAPPDLSLVQYPYHLYTDEDIANRVVYVETSRGCPLGCHYCSSSVGNGVRQFPLESILSELGTLLERGVHHFKFVDRSFNCPPERACEILQFFLNQPHSEFYLHFEFLPLRLNEELKLLLSKFPEGSLHIEVGIQTFSSSVGRTIGRNIPPDIVEETLRFLVNETSAFVHGDLIIGLPGDTVDSLGSSFNRLWVIGIREIQLNLLKSLKGTPLSCHSERYAMEYSEFPPYEVLQTSTMSFSTLRRLHECSRVFNTLIGSNNFSRTGEYILNWSKDGKSPDQFAGLERFTDYLLKIFKRTHHLSLKSLLEPVYTYLTATLSLDPRDAGELLALDYYDGGRRKRLPWIEERRRSPLK